MEVATIKKTKKSTWVEKREKEAVGYPKIVEIPNRWANTIGDGKMVILTPKIIDNFIRKIPKGKLATINTIRHHFAEEYNVDETCPMTTGIFVWICAGAAEEDRADGKKQIAPYWRVLKEGGKLNPKYPGGVRQHAKYLEGEGFEIIRGDKDASWRVYNYDQYLMNV